MDNKCLLLDVSATTGSDWEFPASLNRKGGGGRNLSYKPASFTGVLQQFNSNPHPVQIASSSKQFSVF